MVKHGHMQTRSRTKTRGRAKTNKPTAFNWSIYKSRCSSLSLLRRLKTRADALLVTSDGYSDRVHWQVLSALCPNLIDQSVLSRNIDTHTGSPRRIIGLPCRIGQQMARLLVGCAYGERELPLSESNLDDFFALCLEYKIDYGISLCLNFARKLLDPMNCVYLFKLALVHHHLKLKCAAYSMMRNNFKQILQINPDFHRLEQRHLESLLKDNALRLNDDEELAWLAILRWMRSRPMTQARLTNLYNQMVAGPQDVVMNLYENNTLPRDALDRPQANRRYSASDAQQPQPIRILLNYYALGYSDERRQPPAARRLSNLTNSPAPLKRFADETADEVRDSQLLALMECLRYMRFKSVTAFDVIADHQPVSCSEKLTSFVNMMRVRYKLRHKIALTNEDRQAISAKQLDRWKMQESSKARRLIKRLSQSIALRPTDQRGDVAEGHAGVASESLSEKCKGERPVDRCAEPRVPRSVGFLFGGWQDGTISDTIWTYDFIYDRWFKLNIRLPEARTLHASCASPAFGHIYIFGGTDGDKILKSVWRFNPYGDVCQRESTRFSDSPPSKKAILKTKKSNLLKRTIERQTRRIEATKLRPARVSYRFKQLCPMNEPRCHLAGVFHSDGRLYALGGHNGNQRLRSAEWYDSNSNQWHRIADMTIARSDAAACSHGDKIFIAGGHISDQLIQSSVEFYKSSDNTWTFAAPMIIPRMSFCLVSHRGLLLALGGTNGLMGGDEVASVTRSVERYNHESGSWTFCAPMAQKRCSFGAVDIGDKLIVLGGHGGYRRLKKCELLRIGQFSATQGPTGGIQSPIVERGTRIVSFAANNQTVGANQEARSNRRSNSIPTSGPNLGLHQLNTEGNQISLRLFPSDNQQANQVTFKRAFKWVRRADLPERRSGFSVAVVPELRNARDYTYFGSKVASRHPDGARKNPSVNMCKSCPLIRQPSRWKKFKIVKRRKLMKHLKIALVVSIVILLM